MRLLTFLSTFLIVALALISYSVVIDMTEPMIDLYTVPMTYSHVPATCSTDSDCGCIDDCLTTKE